MNNKCIKCGNVINNGQQLCPNCLSQQQTQNNLVQQQNNQNIQMNNIQVNQSTQMNMEQNTNPQNIVQPVNNQNNINQNQKPKKKRSGCLTVFLVFIVIIVILIIAIVILTRPKEPTEILSFQKDYPYMGITEDNIYTINNAEQDINFYVTSDTKYKITDSNGKEIETILENNKITNPNKYDKGKKYTITLTEGKFLSNQLETTNKVEFKIKRDEVKKYKYSDKVKTVSSKDVKIVSDKTINTNKKYNVGDVVVLGNKDDISAAYYITKANNNNYEVREAKINEIFSELDYYYEAPVDLSNIKIAEEIKEYVASNVENSKWYETLVEEVHASPPITVDIKEKDGGVEATVKIKVTPGQNAIIINPKNHTLEITFKQMIYIECVSDITLENWDVTFNITSTQSFDFKIKNKLYEYKDAEAKDATKELISKLKEVIEKGEASDSANKDADVATIIIPLGIPGLNVTLDLELVSTITISADFGLSMGNTTNIVVGFDYGIGEEFKFIGSYDKEFKDATISFSGKIEEKLGIKLSLGVDLIGVVKLKVSAASGLYESAETKITYTTGKTDSFDLTFKVESGIYLDFSVGADLIEEIKYEHTFASKKWPLLVNTRVSTKDFNEQTQLNENDTNEESQMYTLQSEKERLERYSCVDSTEDENYIKYKYNYKNGKFDGVEMTGVYYINTGIEPLDNFLRLIIQILSVLFKVYYNFGTYYYENGYYSYIVVPLREEDMKNEFGDINYENYYTFKAAMDEQGMTCK